MTAEIQSLSADGIDCNVSERVLTITLNRPKKLNSFSYPMLEALLRALQFGESSSEVGAIIVTGSGRAFSAGTDISPEADGFQTSHRRTDDGGFEGDFGGIVALHIYRSSKPIMAAINGPAVGFGSTLTLPMDMRFASENAYFSFIFARRGLMPEACATWFLPRVVGITRALDWGLSGRHVSAKEAKEAGLLAEVIPADQLLSHVRKAAISLIASTSPTSLMACRRAMWAMLATPDPETAHKLESEMMVLLRAGKDFSEAISSFYEKRPPIFEKVANGEIRSRLESAITRL
jgi:enoyl-CoA hydratase/carnithine racemase